MKSESLVSIILVTSMLLVTGCGITEAVNARSQADKLDRSVTEYYQALRWGLYREAVSFHITRNEKFSEVDIDELERVEVAKVDIISKQIIPSSEEGGINEAVIEAELSYFLVDQGTLREMNMSQIWWYNPKFKHWLIESDFPEFK